MGTKLRQPPNAKQRALATAFHELRKMFERAHPEHDPRSVWPEDLIPWVVSELERLAAIGVAVAGEGRRG